MSGHPKTVGIRRLLWANEWVACPRLDLSRAYESPILHQRKSCLRIQIAASLQTISPSVCLTIPLRRTAGTRPARSRYSNTLNTGRTFQRAFRQTGTPEYLFWRTPGHRPCISSRFPKWVVKHVRAYRWNPKSKFLNPKQYQNTKHKIPNSGSLFEFLLFWI